MHVITAIFPDRDTAVAARNSLGKDHFSFRWLAVTKPVDHADADGGAADHHEVEQTSDGAIGALGRFLSGAGSSLQRALMDHNVTREDAETVDASIGTSGAVLVVHSSTDRSGEAGKLLEAGGGKVISITTSGTVPVYGTKASPGYHAVDDAELAPAAQATPVGATVLPESLDDEYVFIERRDYTPRPPSSTL